MSTYLGRFHQRFSDPLLTVLTLMLSFLLFGIGPMQASGIVTGQHFGYLFGLVLLPAAFLYSRNLLVAAPIAVAIALLVTAALLEFEQSPRTDLYLDSAAWLIAGLALSVAVARAVFGPGRITYHRVLGAVLLYLIIGLIFVALYGFVALSTPVGSRIFRRFMATLPSPAAQQSPDLKDRTSSQSGKQQETTYTLAASHLRECTFMQFSALTISSREPAVEKQFGNGLGRHLQSSCTKAGSACFDALPDRLFGNLRCNAATQFAPSTLI